MERTVCPTLLAVVLLTIVLAEEAGALRITFFDQKDYKGDSYSFCGGEVEEEGDCTRCVMLKTESWWESYKSSAGSVVLYDSANCTGRSSDLLPAQSGNLWSLAFTSPGSELQRPGRSMQFIAAASIESFRLCRSGSKEA